MNKQELIAGIRERKIIAILRGLPERQAVQTAQALYAGGIRFIEITFAQDREECLRDTAGAIRAVSGLYPDLHVGAGTVLTLSQLEAAEAAGAAYIISPNTDEEIIRQTVCRGLVSIPGAMTPMWGDRIFEKCGIRRDEEGDGGKTLEIRGKRRLSARDGGANYQQS